MSFRLHTRCLLILCHFAVVTSLSAQSLVGKWEGETKAAKGTFIFDKEGYVVFTINGATKGGKLFESSPGVHLSLFYQIDNKAKPHNIDFVLMKADGSLELTRMIGIYEFLNKKTLILNMDFKGKTRPTQFNDEDTNQITLKKIKS
jgi:uncharacterized protein (TIGR03067 family)